MPVRRFSAAIMVTQVGFFHFGNNHTDPLGALHTTLLTAAQQADITQSLIVLPEAFNLGKWYRDAGPYDTSLVSRQHWQRVQEQLLGAPGPCQLAAIQPADL